MDDRLVVSLLRHGLTLENERGAYIGWTDVPLSKAGKEQLIKNDSRLIDVEVVFSSPLQRCIQTANILFPNKEIIQLETLKELHFGAWEGKTYEQLKENEHYKSWLTDIFSKPIEAGETYEQFGERIGRGLQAVKDYAIKKQVNRVAIVTHGGVIRYMLHTLFPDKKSFFDWKIPFGTGYELTWMKGQLEGETEECTLLVADPIMVKQIG